MDACVSLLQKAALVAQSAGEGVLVVECVVECGECYLALREFAMAERFLLRAREVASETDSPAMRAEVYRGFAALYRARGDLKSAAVCADRALEVLDRHGGADARARALVELGEVYLQERRMELARAALGQARALGEGGETALRVRILLDLGVLARWAGQQPVALQHYASAAALARGGSLPFECELACMGLAALLEEAGRLGEALGALREGLALSTVACTGQGLEPIELARVTAMGRRLLSIETRAAKLYPDGPPRRAVDETVRLYNMHPLVVAGRVPRYGSVDARLAPRAAPNLSRTSQPPPHAPHTQTLISGSPHRVAGGSAVGRE
jgi:hypothetical protein